MTTGGKIALGLGVTAALVGGGIVAWKLSTTPSKKQYSSLQTKSAEIGSDMFDGMNPREIAEHFKYMKENLSKKEVKNMIELMAIGESNWTASDKVDFGRMMKKWQGV